MLEEANPGAGLLIESDTIDEFTLGSSNVFAAGAVTSIGALRVEAVGGSRARNHVPPLGPVGLIVTDHDGRRLFHPGDTTMRRPATARQRCRIDYRRTDEPESRRELDPYGLVTLLGRWYVHGFCYLRQARRTFRVDRITQVRALPRHFTAPTGLDIVAEVERTLIRGRERTVELEVDAPPAAVRAELPRHFAELDPLENDRTRLRSSTSNLDWFAWRIGDLPFDVRVVSPAALRESLRRAAASLLQIADA